MSAEQHAKAREAMADEVEALENADEEVDLPF